MKPPGDHGPQLSIDFDALPVGRALALEGMQRAIDHTEADQPGWTDVACDALAKFAATVNEFALEDFRFASRDVLPSPSTHYSWGSLGRIAALRSIIRFTGRYEPAKSAKTHGHPVRIYTRAG